jgi:hypothetical protein
MFPCGMAEFEEPPKPAPAPKQDNAERARRHAARKFFLDAPMFLIEFDTDGSALLCEKRYEYWPDAGRR